MDTGKDPQPYIEAARRLAPALREAAPRTDAERRLPPEIVEAMRKEGFFHLTLAEAAGGEGLDPVAQSRVVEEIAFADGSAGWCSMISNQNGAFAVFMHPDDARETFGRRQIMCGTARPIGKAVVVEGGYMVSGRWPFASGSSHADWFMGESVIYDGETARMGPDGNPQSGFPLLPRDSVTVIDTWDTTGLRGTASNDFTCKDVFVPANRFVMLGEPQTPSPILNVMPLFAMNHGSHALGIARAALECAKEIAVEKMAYGNRTTIAGERRTQLLVADAAVTIAAARTYLYDVCQKAWEAGCAGPTDTLTRSRARLATGHAAKSSVRAVDMLHEALGTASVFTKNPIERQFRDIHTAGAHVMIGTLVYEAAGRAELGLEPDFAFF